MDEPSIPRQTFTVQLSTLEHEYLLTLLTIEGDLDPESRHLPRESELGQDALTQLRAMRRVGSDE